MWRYFTTKEVVNPYFDDCPAKSWGELPPNVQVNLSYTLELLDKIRTFMGERIRINSTYRPNSQGSAHSFGMAVDFQYVRGGDILYKKTMDFLYNDMNIKDFRAIVEYKGLDHWIHLDRGFRDVGKKVCLVGYQKEGVKMYFERYEGLLPREILQYSKEL